MGEDGTQVVRCIKSRRVLGSDQLTSCQSSSVPPLANTATLIGLAKTVSVDGVHVLASGNGIPLRVPRIRNKPGGNGGRAVRGGFGGWRAGVV